MSAPTVAQAVLADSAARPMPEAAARLLQCPICRGDLIVDGNGGLCGVCRASFPRTPLGQLDLRLPPGTEIQYTGHYAPLSYDRFIGTRVSEEANCPETRNTYSGPIPHHLTAAQVSWIPASPGEDLALDLGCGNGVHRGVLQALGYRYYSADYQSDHANDLVDAHALPYRSNVFDFVLSVAVLEHLAQPLLALGEIYRVMKPNSYFIGTAAFLEPFHDNSFAHLTHLGLWSALLSQGFHVETVSPIKGWNVFRANLEMGFASRLPQSVTRAIASPFAIAATTHAAIARSLGRETARHEKAVALARHAGAFFFVSRKLGSELV